jgi:enoyl-CoA hydratase/carnithine racemase
MSEANAVKVIYDKSIARLVFNRPKQLNGLNDDIRKVISTTLNDLMERPDIRLLVFSAEGKSSCSGADLKTTSWKPDRYFATCDGAIRPHSAGHNRIDARSHHWQWRFAFDSLQLYGGIAGCCIPHS